MKKVIQNLRQKSKSSRQKIALWGALCITGCVLVVWLGVIQVRLVRVSDGITTENPLTLIKNSLFKLIPQK